MIGSADIDLGEHIFQVAVGAFLKLLSGLSIEGTRSFIYVLDHGGQLIETIVVVFPLLFDRSVKEILIFGSPGQEAIFARWQGRKGGQAVQASLFDLLHSLVQSLLGTFSFGREPTQHGFAVPLHVAQAVGSGYFASSAPLQVAQIGTVVTGKLIFEADHLVLIAGNLTQIRHGHFAAVYFRQDLRSYKFAQTSDKKQNIRNHNHLPRHFGALLRLPPRPQRFELDED